jgi:hypothetical protein
MKGTIVRVLCTDFEAYACDARLEKRVDYCNEGGIAVGRRGDAWNITRLACFYSGMAERLFR